MSLLEKASLIITPNATKAGKLYSVVPNAPIGDMDVVRATTATRVNSLGLIENVGLNVPRLDYTDGSCPSILVEGQRTNQYTYSQQLNQWGTIGSPIITENDSISPDGSQNADRVQFSGSSDFLFRLGTGSAGTNVLSVYAKAKSGTSQKFQFFANAGANTSGDLIATNEWKRFEFIYTYSQINAGIQGSIIGTSDVLFYGFQHEAGSYATSYIPTVATTVTRNADVISKTGISSLIGQTEGTLYCNVNITNPLSGDTRRFMAIGDGTIANRIGIGINTVNKIEGFVVTSSILQSLIETPISISQNYKIAISYKLNDVVFYVNGIQIGADILATIPAVSNFYLMHEFNQNLPASNGIKEALLFKTRLTNDELSQLTTL